MARQVRRRELHFAQLEKGGGRPEATLVFHLVQHIERSIGRLRILGAKLSQLRNDTAIAQTSRLDALAAQDDWRKGTRNEELETFAFRQKTMAANGL